MAYPLLSDYNKEIAKAYDVLIEPDGIPLRGLFIIDPKVNDIIFLCTGNLYFNHIFFRE